MWNDVSMYIEHDSGHTLNGGLSSNAQALLINRREQNTTVFHSHTSTFPMHVQDRNYSMSHNGLVVNNG